MVYAVQTTPAWQAPSLPPFLQDLLTFRGRMNRARYWGAVLSLMCIAIVMGLVAGATRSMIQSGVAAAALAIITAVALLPLAVPGYFIAIKRLHDRNKSGHWLWLFYLAPAVLNLLAKLAVAQGAAPVGVVINLVSIGISIWGFVEIGCLRGTSGPNRFGPDLLQAQAFSSGQAQNVAPAGGILTATFQGASVAVDGARPLLRVGRGRDNDLVVSDRFASGKHARIECRGEQFFLIDQSSNGTYVSIQGMQEMQVAGREIVLHGSGLIGLGTSPATEPEFCIRFAIQMPR